MSTSPMERIPHATGTLQAAAAEWLVRIQNDELSMEEIAEWQQWLGASAQHRQAFERMQRLWQGFESLPNKVPPALPSIAPGWRAGRRIFAAAAGALVVMAAALGALYLRQNGVLHLSAGAVAFETESREHREVTLQDGSRLMLGGLSLALVSFDAAEREVKLDRGEAFFEVAKDAGRPFVVRAGEATITAVGTAFNVRKAGERIHVTVTEGAVKVRMKDDRAEAAAVPAGHQVILDPSDEAPKVQSTIPAAATAWRSGRLEYLGEPLKYVVADVNRYSTRQISISDPHVGELLLTGTVFENDIDTWLRSVEALLPVKVEHTEPDRIVLSPR